VRVLQHWRQSLRSAHSPQGLWWGFLQAMALLCPHQLPWLQLVQHSLLLPLPLLPHHQHRHTHW
jgi:hypothetical protein